MTVPVLGRAEIEAAARPGLVLDAVRAALIAHAAGRTTVPAPTHLNFPAAHGDCHVKTGWIDGCDDFPVKIASGLYRNPRRGEPVNHGLVCVIGAHTGRIRAVLDDGGCLTAWRTAAAGALAGHAPARPGARSVGVFGTGEQARLQVRWLAMLRPVGRVLVHGRDERRAAAFCDHLAGHGLSAVPAPAAEAAGADIVVTATPAVAPVLDADAVRPGAHLTAVGADMPHKNELPPALFARAGVIATVDHEQCLHHGDLAHAVRAGAVPPDADVPFGTLLLTPPDTDTAVTIADLTGVGALDAAVASAVVRELPR
ncbi:ornithine cyclodeaminase family protein [Actinacidiphila glaucinigra]|uniref:ornithine cyclodeaminase family protein n=1 Tax=Actinacidiphila glaucinigra TaxID=235986 RepID=UPI0037A506F9